MLENVTSDRCDSHLSSRSRVFFGCALAIVTFVGIVGNLILAQFVWRKSERRSLVNVLLATMAISDVIISTFCTPFDFLAIIYNKWILNQLLCCVHSFLLSFCGALNVSVLIVLSLDRYFILVLKRDKLRGCHMATVVSLCAVSSAAVSSPPLFDPAYIMFANEHCRQTYDTTHIHAVYSLTYSCLLFVLPCGLLLMAYIHIIIVIRKAKRTVQPRCVHVIRNPVRPIRVNVQFKQKSFSTILYLYGAAMICKLPLALWFVRSLTDFAVCPVAQWIMLLTYLNSAFNPLIYAVRISEYSLILAGKLFHRKAQIMSFRREPSRRSQPQSVYMIPANAISSVL